MLLGSGASDPSGCRQNAVTESVDSIVPAGYIQHALLILNGRCTGPAPEQQLQMQYQLMRAFGRILGLGWSQVNDNVFTGSSAADLLSGAELADHASDRHYLRPVHLSMPAATVHPAAGRSLGAGTALFHSAESQLRRVRRIPCCERIRSQGALLFPTGQGMQGVNVVVRRWHQFTGCAPRPGRRSRRSPAHSSRDRTVIQ